MAFFDLTVAYLSCRRLFFYSKAASFELSAAKLVSLTFFDLDFFQLIGSLIWSTATLFFSQLNLSNGDLFFLLLSYSLLPVPDTNFYHFFRIIRKQKFIEVALHKSRENQIKGATSSFVFVRFQGSITSMQVLYSSRISKEIHLPPNNPKTHFIIQHLYIRTQRTNSEFYDCAKESNTGNVTIFPNDNYSQES